MLSGRVSVVTIVSHVLTVSQCHEASVSLLSLSLDITHHLPSASTPAIHNVQSAFLIILPLTNERLLSSREAVKLPSQLPDMPRGQGLEMQSSNKRKSLVN